MTTQRTRVEFMVQGSSEDAASYSIRLQDRMDAIGARDNVNGPCFCMPTSASDGRMTTAIQWQELTTPDDAFSKMYKAIENILSLSGLWVSIEPTELSPIEQEARLQAAYNQLKESITR